MKKIYPVLLILLMQYNLSIAQNVFRARVLDSETKEALAGVTVQLEGTSYGAQSDNAGNVAIRNIPNGEDKFQFSFVGYEAAEVKVTYPASDTTLIVSLKPVSLSTSEVMVTSLRSTSRIEDLPIKVEVLGYDEINEENGIVPGNVVSLLGDISGVQVQQTSVASGEQSLKMLGLGGKYTQVLRDGLPLYEGLSGGLGLLQIPPLDLKQVEIIKGASPILYGGGAIAGIINLVSKEPTDKKEITFTLNRTSLSENNFNGYYSARNDKTGITMFAAVNTRQAKDVDNDGFSDSPEFKNYYIHPRLFYYPDETSKLIVGYSNLFENRIGGNMSAVNNSNGPLHNYFERNKSYRNTAELEFHKELNGKRSLDIKSTGTLFRRSFNMNDFSLDGRQFLTYSEASYAIPSREHTTVFGLNFLSENYKTLASENKNITLYSNYTSGMFIQDEWAFQEHISLESGLRVDYNNKYKFFFLPQLSFLYRPEKTLSLRLGGGLGYKTPGLFTEDVEDNELKNLMPISSSVNAEHSLGLNFDAKYETLLFDEISLTMDQAFYYTRINDPVSNEIRGGQILIGNYYDYLDSKGSESYLRLTADELDIYFGYNYTFARRSVNSLKSELPFTPRNKAAAIVTYDLEGLGRMGLEASYVGRQFTEDKVQKRGYWIAAAMIAGSYRYFEVVFNVENLFDIRQSRYEKIITGPLVNPVFQTLWAPIEGRVFNLSLKITM
ncbi:MAG: TonB-dependent receptor [Bacteroidota bacterium]|jgi:outer membrane receptor protein involved in Fe transport|nr:TonB-dependent receptor [Ignavibacteria bacterium]MCU7511446.1 TonB-dependent receptor [Ignavibacteria bacterium]MCU7524674.1 TonB-dependent receptor [Ignavibacteria bacterium]HEX2960560.1 TonB-dependent receptor [Ignavibacteriales bacterium]